MNEPATYMSFLVRLWREPGGETLALHADWRGEIECIQTGQRWTYLTLDELLGLLRQQAQELAAPGCLGESH